MARVIIKLSTQKVRMLILNIAVGCGLGILLITAIRCLVILGQHAPPKLEDKGSYEEDVKNILRGQSYEELTGKPPYVFRSK